MKKLLLMATALFMSQHAYSATCTAPSRSNVAANSVLTSTEYNTSLNNAYNALAAGNLDLGCAASGSLDDTASLNSTTFNALLNAVKDGCIATASDSNTISINRCMLAVNGSFVRTSTATTVTWGCSGCSGEASSTLYYVYVATGSSGSTLTLKILTGAPNADGYDGSGNRLLAKFFNNASDNIVAVQNAIQGNRFEQIVTDNTSTERIERAYIAGGGSCASSPCTITSQSGAWLSSVTRTGAGSYTLNFVSGIFSAVPNCMILAATEIAEAGATGTSTTFLFVTADAAGTPSDSSRINVICMGPRN